MSTHVAPAPEPEKDYTYIFDIIVTHIEAPKEHIDDPKQWQVEATFTRRKLTLTSSSINVTELTTGKGEEVQATPTKMRQMLEECGLPIAVKYNGNLLGTGQMIFPAAIIERIVPEMSDIMHVDTVNFERSGEAVGKLEILCRLIAKCEVPADELGRRDCRKHMDKSINPQDILFVMGEGQRYVVSCDPCQDALEPEEGDELLNLDLLRYRSGTGRRVDQMDQVEFLHNPCANTACCQLKQMAKEYEQVINTITQNTGMQPPPQPPCRLAPGAMHMQQQGEPAQEPTFPCFSYAPAYDGDNSELANQCFIPVPIGDTLDTDIKPIRFCPICLTNMSWLPKFAACPKCGVKPTPVMEDRHKEKKLTADEIIIQYLGKPAQGVDDYCVDPCEEAKRKATEAPEDDCNECRCTCTCKGGKLCAHCRIRKLCADVFQSEKPPCHKPMPQPSEDYCVLAKSEEDCRPYLARVFSELRDLYDIKDTKKKPSDYEEECATVLSKLEPKKTKSQKNESPRKQTKTNVQSSQTVATEVSKSHLRQKSPTRPLAVDKPKFWYPKYGHKCCVKVRKAVPRYHGWDWHRSTEARKHGWQPGAIRKPIKKLMKFFLQYPPKENAFQTCQRIQQAQKANQAQLPILNVAKKQGEIFITLRSVARPGVHMKPIVFKVVKSDMAKSLREIKHHLKDKGFAKCKCHQTIMLCTCREREDKRRLEAALKKECKRRFMPSCVDKVILTDTSDSEMEFDFDVTPPAGVVRPPGPPKPRVVNNSTQTTKKDRQPVPPRWPVKMNPYYRAFDCAVGDRYTGTAFGKPGEQVFEDGAFGHFGGGPHGAPAAPGGRPKNAAIWGSGAGGPMQGVGGGGGRGGGAGGGGAKGFPGGGKKGPGGGGGAGGGGGGVGGRGGGAGGGGGGGPLPVRMPARFAKSKQEAAIAKKNQEQKEKKGVDMMKYLNSHSGGKGGKGGKGKGPNVGPDGLTDAQRRRRKLLEMPVPPLCTIARRGKGFDPCAPICYDCCGVAYDPRFVC